MVTGRAKRRGNDDGITWIGRARRERRSVSCRSERERGSMARCWPQRGAAPVRVVRLWDVDNAKMKRKMVTRLSETVATQPNEYTLMLGCGDVLTSAIVLRRNRPGTQVRHSTTKCRSLAHWPQKSRQAPPINLSFVLSRFIYRFTRANRLPVRTFSRHISRLPHAVCYSLDWGEPCTHTLRDQSASPRSSPRLTSPCLVDRVPRLYPRFPLHQVSPTPPPVPLLRPLLQLRPVILWFTLLKTRQW